MKVVQINAVSGIGSTGRLVAELDAGLNARGIESRIVYSDGIRPRDGLLIGTIVENKVHALASRLSGRQGHFSRRGTLRLLEYLSWYGPDVVHLHNLHANYIHLPVLLRFLAQKDIATVVTLHDCWFYTGKCCHYSMEGCARWRTGCGACPRVHKDNPSWFLDRSSELWAEKQQLFGMIPRLGVVGVSDWVTQEAKRSLLSSASIIERIHNWVDTDTFSPSDASGLKRSLGVHGAFLVLGVATDWRESKGLADVASVAGQLASEHSGQSWGSAPHGSHGPQVVLVGGWRHNQRMPPTVQCVGHVSDTKELARYYSAADVLLQLSREETFGMVTAEALSCGTPAIVYDCTANSELIGDRCGYVTKPGRVAEVVHCVHEVQRLTKSHYAAACRSSAVSRFRREDRIDDHVDLYARLCRMKMVN